MGKSGFSLQMLLCGLQVGALAKISKIRQGYTGVVLIYDKESSTFCFNVRNVGAQML